MLQTTAASLYPTIRYAGETERKRERNKPAEEAESELVPLPGTEITCPAKAAIATCGWGTCIGAAPCGVRM